MKKGEGERVPLYITYLKEGGGGGERPGLGMRMRERGGGPFLSPLYAKKEKDGNLYFLFQRGKKANWGKGGKEVCTSL